MEEQVVSVEDIEEDNLLVKVSRKLGTIPISFFYLFKMSHRKTNSMRQNVPQKNELNETKLKLNFYKNYGNIYHTKRRKRC